MAMVLHYTHTLWDAVSVGDMVMDGFVLFPRTFPNNCDVCTGGDLPHKSHLLPTECPCVHESRESSENVATLCSTVDNAGPHLLEIYWKPLSWGHLAIMDKIVGPIGVYYRGVPL